MNIEERDRLCDLELDRICEVAGIIKDPATGAEKSGALRMIADHITEFLKMIDSNADIQEIEGFINRFAKRIDSPG